MRYIFDRVSQSMNPNFLIIEGSEDGGFGLSLVIGKGVALALALQLMERLGYSVNYWLKVDNDE